MHPDRITVARVADLDTMIADLERLVSIESPSHDVEALTKSADGLAALIGCAHFV